MVIKFVHLPTEVIEAVILHLTAARDRVCLLVSCRRLWQLEPGLGKVWHDFSARILAQAQAQYLLHWVQGRRHRLRTVNLRYRYDSEDEGDSGWDTDEEDGELLDDWDEELTVSSLLTGSTVRELRILSNRSFHLGSWLGALPELESLAVTTVGYSTFVRQHFSCLTRLTHLSLHGGDVEMAGMSAPAAEGAGDYGPSAHCGLTAFCRLLLGDAGCAVPIWRHASLPALTAIRALSLSGFKLHAVLEPLVALTLLTALSLTHCGLFDVPVELGALTALCVLDLSGNCLVEPGALQPLLALSRLTSLDLCPKSGRPPGHLATLEMVVPAGVLQLPELKVLRLSAIRAFGDIVAPLPPLTAPACLKSLTMRLPVASRSCATLAQLTSLRTLGIHCPWYEVPPTSEYTMKQNADAIVFLRPLLKLPRVTIEWVLAIPPDSLLRLAAANGRDVQACTQPASARWHAAPFAHGVAVEVGKMSGASTVGALWHLCAAFVAWRATHVLAAVPRGAAVVWMAVR